MNIGVWEIKPHKGPLPAAVCELNEPFSHSAWRRKPGTLKMTTRDVFTAELLD